MTQVNERNIREERFQEAHSRSLDQLRLDYIRLMEFLGYATYSVDIYGSKTSEALKKKIAEKGRDIGYIRYKFYKRTCKIHVEGRLQAYVPIEVGIPSFVDIDFTVSDPEMQRDMLASTYFTLENAAIQGFKEYVVESWAHSRLENLLQRSVKNYSKYFPQEEGICEIKGE